MLAILSSDLFICHKILHVSIYKQFLFFENNFHWPFLFTFFLNFKINYLKKLKGVKIFYTIQNCNNSYHADVNQSHFKQYILISTQKICASNTDNLKERLDTAMLRVWNLGQSGAVVRPLACCAKVPGVKSCQNLSCPPCSKRVPHIRQCTILSECQSISA